jgi:uncharacterized protein
MAAVNDAHCHFFSTPFFAALGGDAALAKLGWEPPGSPEALADRWVAELDRHGVGRAALIASIPGDAASVAAAVARHRERFVGFFMVDPTAADAATTAAAALDGGWLRAMCLFPSMHRYAIHDDRVVRLFEIAAARPGTAVFVHCGVLSVGVRRKLGLPSAFDLRCGNPIALQSVASRFGSVPVIVPHFGAGFFREALMAADMCPNIHFDTSSSNAWINYHPGLTLEGVFRQALEVVGPERLLFGTDSSFFPRGWVGDVYERQSAALHHLGADDQVRQKIFTSNFDRLFRR